VVKNEEPMQAETRNRQDSANEDMLAKVVDESLAPPAQSISRSSTPDLYPDNMASRVTMHVADPQPPSLEELSSDKMGSGGRVH
jgi:hypothetical protein